MKLGSFVQMLTLLLWSLCGLSPMQAQVSFPYIDELENDLDRCGLPTCTSSWIENSATTDEPSNTLENAVKGWMGKLPDSRRLADISIPGTHDSGSRFGGVGPEAQNWTIKEQLEGGIRLIDIRLVLNGDEDGFNIYHGDFYQHLSFEEVMLDVKEFLDQNPGEGILMRVKKEHGSDDITQFVKVWNTYAARYHAIMTGAINDPTLGQIRGKIFVMREFLLHGNTGSGPENIGKTFYDSNLDIQNEYAVYAVKVLKGVSIYEKIDSVKHYLNKADTSSKWVINWLSGAFGMTPEHIAWQVNREAFEYLDTRSSQTRVGTLIMDFPGEGLIYRIIKTNFDFYKRRKYYLQIDCFQPFVSGTGSEDYITVAFFNGSETLGTVSKKPDCDGISDAKYRITADVLANGREITHVSVETSGDDAFYMDELFLKVPDGGLFDADTELAHWGRESGSGWVLSTDPSDKINGVSARPCSLFRVDGTDEPGGCVVSEPLLDYYVQIDCNHEDYSLSETQTTNTITVSFYKDSELLGSRKITEPDCNSLHDEKGFSISAKPKPTHVVIITNGGNPFFMDELFLKVPDADGPFDEDSVLAHWGGENKGGFILSTNPDNLDDFDENEGENYISECFKFNVSDGSWGYCGATARCRPSIEVNLDSNGVAAIRPADLDKGSTSDYGYLSLRINALAFDCSDLGNNIVTLRAQGEYGPATTCQTSVKVMDVTPPKARCQDVTVELDELGLAILDPGRVDLGSVDECKFQFLSLGLSQNTFTCSDIGNNEIAFYALDSYGNRDTCQAVVTVVDHTIPVAQCIADTTVYLNAKGIAVLNAEEINAGSLNACGKARFELDKSVFYCRDQGVNSVTLTAQNDNGESTCTTTVTIERYPGLLPPCLDTVFLNVGTDQAPGSVEENPIVFGNTPQNPVDGKIHITVGGSKVPVDVSCLIPECTRDEDLEFSLVGYSRRAAYPVGCVKVMDFLVRVEDVAPGGFVSWKTDEFAIRVRYVDNSPPQLIAGDIQATTDPGVCGSMVTFQVQATDSGPVHYTFSHNPGTIFPLGTTTVSVSATDFCGNTAYSSFEVMVEDIEAPRIECLGMEIPVYLDAAGMASVSPASLVEVSADACGIASLELDKSTFDCADAGKQTLTVTATDNNGLSSSCQASILVLDKVLPEALCHDITVQLDASGQAFIVKADIDAGSNDACGILTTGLSQNEFDCGDVGENVVSFMAIDKHYNASTCLATVTVEDNIPPVMVLKPNVLLYPPDKDMLDLSIEDMVESVRDNCAIGLSDVVITHVSSDEERKKEKKEDIIIGADCQSISLRKDRQGGGNGRVYTVHLLLTDAHGHTATGQYLVSMKAKGGSTTATDDGPEYTRYCGEGQALAQLREDSPAGPPRSGHANNLSLEVFPNPFREQANIRYRLSEPSSVHIEIYNLHGQSVHARDLGQREAGEHLYEWHAHRNTGAPLPSGVYFIRLYGRDQDVVKRVSLF